jgi:hypothetical protein
MSNNTNITRKFETTQIKAVLTQGARGKSTYEIWLEEGNVGSVADFLNSMDRNFIFTQTIPSATWTIEHNLNKFPSVTVVDEDDNVYYGEVIYENSNEITINFTGAFSGKAYLN